MDNNKLEKLRWIHYKIHQACGLCSYGEFPKNDWGTCSYHTYKHKKHSVKLRNLSIHKYGYCWNFSPDEKKMILFNKFEEFLGQ